MSRKGRTTEEFIDKAKLKHGDKFDYSLVKYINAKIKVKIICPKHGIIEIPPCQHLLYDCAKCAGVGKFSNEEIVKQFKEIHGNKYDYSEVKYKGDSIKVEIICPEHGSFMIKPNSHKILKSGCSKCGHELGGYKQRIQLNEFINRIEKIYGKNKFKYEKAEYIDAHTPITLICKKCNNIESKAPTVWYAKYGCLKCDGNILGPKIKTNEYFINKAKAIHGSRYDYSITSYTKSANKVDIICNKHGIFSQIASVHISSKSGCPKCSCSRGEIKIENILKFKKIKYIHQYRVKIDNSNHYFDFYLPDCNIIIEFNGLQHYKPIKFFGGQKGFEYLKQRDKIKKKYCLENNLNLIIIHYNDMDNIIKLLDL